MSGCTGASSLELGEEPSIDTVVSDGDEDETEGEGEGEEGEEGDDGEWPRITMAAANAGVVI